MQTNAYISWADSASESQLSYVSEEEFHEMTGDALRGPDFSYGDLDAESIITYADGAWLLVYVAQREGIKSFWVLLPQSDSYYATQEEAEKALWEGHSKFETGANLIENEAQLTAFLQDHCKRVNAPLFNSEYDLKGEFSKAFRGRVSDGQTVKLLTKDEAEEIADSAIIGAAMAEIEAFGMCNDFGAAGPDDLQREGAILARIFGLDWSFDDEKGVTFFRGAKS